MCAPRIDRSGRMMNLMLKTKFDILSVDPLQSCVKICLVCLYIL